MNGLARVRVSAAPFAPQVAVDQGHARTVGRRGLLVEVCRADGVAAVGEASPYPGLSPETLDDVERATRRLELPGDFVDHGDFATTVDRYLAGLDDVLAGLPSLRFALETVVTTWLCADRGCDLASVVSDGAPAPIVDVAALVATPAEATEAVALGFSTLKLKLSPSNLPLLAATRAAVGEGIRLRVDLNGASTPETWPNLERQLSAAAVELCEDPVRPELMATLPAGAIPVFWDERVGADMRAVLAAPVSGVVLKPTLVGGLVRCKRLAREAARAGKRVVVTHAFESAVGLFAVRALAHAMPLQGLAHGVDRHVLAEPFVPRTPRLTRSA